MKAGLLVIVGIPTFAAAICGFPTIALCMGVAMGLVWAFANRWRLSR
jgi:hypothetical protein